MPWFKIDDTMPDHPKFIAAGNAATGLWAKCGAWSMRQLTDGFVPTAVVRQYGTNAQAQRLVDVGLWIAKDDGFLFHEWTQRQPSRAKVQADREANAARIQRWRDKRSGESDPDL
jgi:hypothetical protein